MKNNDIAINLDEIKKCLERSGYLMESRLVKMLNEAGYFVEPNQSICDPKTGKSREIDIIAENYNHNPNHKNICVKTVFVIEAINNKNPFILLTKRPISPSADFESYVKYIVTPSSAPFLNELDIYEKRGGWENLFSQYCTLTEKRSGDKLLMASHSEDVYSSLLKMSEYVENEISRWNLMEGDLAEKYWRLFFWQPMLVLSGKLICVSLQSDGSPCFEDVNSARLEFNWHSNDLPKTTVIEIITEKFLLEKLATVTNLDDEMSNSLHLQKVCSAA